MKGENLMRKKCISCLIVITLMFGLPTFAVHGEQSDSSVVQTTGQTVVSGWQKTFDRHELLSAAYGNHIYTAVGGDGVIRTSTDGENWPVSYSTGIPLQSVVWGKDKFVAVGNLGQILISTDGEKWDAVNSGTDKNLTGVAWNGTNFAIVGDRGTILVSADGVSWAKQPLETAYSFSRIISGSGKYIATINDTFNTILTSDDGVNWKEAEPASDLYGYNNPAYNGETFIMSAKIPHQDGSVMLASRDGENWTEVKDAPRVNSLASDGSRFIALGDTSMDENNRLTQNLYISADGEKWDTHSITWGSGYYSDLRIIKYLNNKWIGLNLIGGIFSSTDGIQWKQGITGLDNSYDKIAWDGGQFVAYDNAGNMATSKDGTAWAESSVKLNLPQPILRINYLDHGVIAVFAGSPAKNVSVK